MKILLTGASGFVGSHILDRLRARQLPVAVLLRPTSARTFLESHLPGLEIRNGSITDPASLKPALAGITHIIHCAGCTKAVEPSEFYAINQTGTRHLVNAANAQGGIERLVHVSSLAVAGPATSASPVRESDPPRPVSEYGKSKLAGEQEVRCRCRMPFVIVRPPAVYGPRDQGFFSMFKAVRNHLRPRPSATQELSLVFVEDLAEAIVTVLLHPKASGKTYFAAAREVVTGRLMAEEIATQMGRWTVPCPLPTTLLWPICLSQEVFGRFTRKAQLLNLQKFSELRAPGWVCDPSLLQDETGYQCPTTLKAGIAETLNWYRQNRWLS